jgi:hypothetical protein
MENMTLQIDPETRDLVFDTDGNFTKIYGDDTTVQNVRHTLLTWKGEFFADETHGTEYERVMGVNQNDVDNGEIDEIMREAIFQEPEISRIDELNTSYENRSVSVEFSSMLKSGNPIRLEVTS